MTAVYITVDTEYLQGVFRTSGASGWQENFDKAIRGTTRDGEVGIFYQMDVLEQHGLKGVFFVDPIPALIFGPDAIARLVEPIVERGHDVQLHIHTEWLRHVDEKRVPTPERGNNIRDFSLNAQIELLSLARDLLVEAGAPAPQAFRAGNYGANNDTLRALKAIGLRYDTSFNPGMRTSPCRIDLPPELQEATEYLGIIEVPISAIWSLGQRRHAQITALSAQEMIAALRHAARSGRTQFTIVSHSFEITGLNRERTNAIVKRRFERICKAIEMHSDLHTATYRENPPGIPEAAAHPPLLPHNVLRTGWRMIEQAVGNHLYGVK